MHHDASPVATAELVLRTAQVDVRKETRSIDMTTVAWPYCHGTAVVPAGVGILLSGKEKKKTETKKTLFKEALLV